MPAVLWGRRPGAVGRPWHLSALVVAAVGWGGSCSAPAPAPAAPIPPPRVSVASPPPLPPAPPALPPLEDRGAVAAESLAAADAGARVLEEGGSAADAVVAMALVAAVVQPTSCGLGGGGFALVWDPASRRATVVDFREVAPGGLRLKDHLGKSPPWERRGVMVGVPGFVAGLAAVHARGGRQPFEKLALGAAALAEGGFRVEPWLAATLVWNEKALRREPRASALFGLGGPEGRLPVEGGELRNEPLAKTLRALAERGPRAFYRGPLAEDVVLGARAFGSSMVAADLADYQPQDREPARVPFGSREVLVPSSPSGGGVVLAQQLLLFPPADVARVAQDSAEGIHLGAEGLRASWGERRSWVGDPAFTRVDMGFLLDPARLRGVRASLPVGSVTPPSGPAIEDGGTCHLVAWDDQGLVVSFTSSIGSMFGAKIATRGGYFLGDSLADFAHDALGQKVLTRGPNFPRARARPASSMAPTLVLEAGEPMLALGGSGGAKIPSAVLQVLQRVLVRDEPLATAIAAPRWHAPSAGGLQIEEGLAPQGEALRARGEAFEAPRASFAAVTAIRVRPNAGRPSFEAASDPRKGGRAKIVRGPPAR